jgi:hypothetical protein
MVIRAWFAPAEGVEVFLEEALPDTAGPDLVVATVQKLSQAAAVHGRAVMESIRPGPVADSKD